MLPTGLSAPCSVELTHRYLPGSQLIEVGGDWYESISLPGARVALVVGDVAGHGVRAAVTMGRLRTAIQTLAMLELSPTESLQQLNDLMRMLGVLEPHFATCVYAVYDAVQGTCEVASAGHLPRCWCGPTATASSWTCRRRRRWGWARESSAAGPSRSRTAACSSCTPTGWWRAGTATSMTA
jgi:serine phosphatase RsbU (regulator of sigma subunit)